MPLGGGRDSWMLNSVTLTTDEYVDSLNSVEPMKKAPLHSPSSLVKMQPMQLASICPVFPTFPLYPSFCWLSSTTQLLCPTKCSSLYVSTIQHILTPSPVRYRALYSCFLSNAPMPPPRPLALTHYRCPWMFLLEFNISNPHKTIHDACTPIHKYLELVLRKLSGWVKPYPL